MENKDFIGTKVLKTTAISILIASLCSCAATQVALEHKDLQTSTKMSNTVFLDPVPPSQKTILVSIKNTSTEALQVASALKKSLAAKGYKLVNDPNRAHYMLQANILKVGKMSQSASASAMGGGYGSALAGATTGAAVGALTNNANTTLAGGLIGGAVGLTADSLVKDVNYAVITDVQISEKSAQAIYQKTQSNLANGSSANTAQDYSKKTNWMRYRTRIASNADKVNLKFAEARPVLEQELVRSLSGIF